MTKKRTREEFDNLIMPHLGEAYNLARWFLGHKQDAEDAVQQSYLKAFKAFDQHSGRNSTAWILKIVRNTCMTMISQRNRSAKVISIDIINDSRADKFAGEQQVLAEALQDLKNSPEAHLLDQKTKQMVWQGVETLSTEFREIIILREFIDMSYEQISIIVDIPIGTVMSRLSRAREYLKRELKRELSSSSKRNKKT